MLVLAPLGALALLGGGLLMPGRSVGAYVVTFLGAVAVGVVGYDMPISTSFDREGIERRCPLRRQRIAWDHIDRIGRTRPLFALWRRRAKGGLVAVRGQRQYLLADRRERDGELDRLITASGLSRDDYRWAGVAQR